MFLHKNDTNTNILKAWLLKWKVFISKNSKLFRYVGTLMVVLVLE